MNICVFCSGQEVDHTYVAAAAEVGRRIGERGHSLVWGGSNEGMMKVVADAVQKAGGKIIGISVEFLRHKARPHADEMIIAKNLLERKDLLLSRSDAYIVLPGGTGTFDELGEVLEQKKHAIHEKPLVILNTANFYKGLKIQLERMKREGFIERPLEELVYFGSTPEESIEYLEISVSH